LNVINKGKKKVVKINTNNWYKDIFVTPDHKYWIGDLSTSSYDSIQSSGIAKLLDKQAKTKPKSSKYTWKEIGEIDNNKMFTLMPKKVEWQLPENFTIDLADFNTRGKITETTIETNGGLTNSIFNRHSQSFGNIQSCYKLGYIFGTFLGDGNSRILTNSSGSCHWSFGFNEIEIANKVKTYIKDLIDYNCTITKKDNKVLSVNCFNKCLAYIFNEFGKKTDKHLPKKYYCINNEYIRGLFDGLIESDGYTEHNKTGSCNKSFANTSEHLIELFNWCCINLGLSYCSMKNKKTTGNLSKCNENNLQQVYNIKTHTTNRYTKDYVYSKVLSCELYDITQVWGIQNTWDIEVDCSTHSFIANNSIVHNSVCTTRKQTGIGMPQFSAIMECSDTAHGLGAHILSDGGLQSIGDFSKAYGAGADFIMSGSMFAAHDESGGELVEENGKKYKIFYGMSSTTAMNKYMGGVASYKSSEGKTVKLEYRGPVANTILNILGGIRSTMTYIGARKIKDIPKCSTFVRVNRQLNQMYSGKEV
jgi:IMP dehydrogenase/GMP reductase